MDTSNNARDQMFAKLTEIYRLTDAFSGMCPSGCTLCEDLEPLMFLQYEDEYIGESIKKSQMDTFLKDCHGCRYQPSGNSCSMLRSSGTCEVYPRRPFDCRSFPVVPYFGLDDDRSIEFYISKSYCPISKDLPKDFIKITIECWKMIADNLSTDWKAMYNKLNNHSYISKIDNATE